MSQNNLTPLIDRQKKTSVGAGVGPGTSTSTSTTRASDDMGSRFTNHPIRDDSAGNVDDEIHVVATDNARPAEQSFYPLNACQYIPNTQDFGQTGRDSRSHSIYPPSSSTSFHVLGSGSGAGGGIGNEIGASFAGSGTGIGSGTRPCSYVGGGGTGAGAGVTGTGSENGESLVVNYVPNKFVRLHYPGQNAHKRKSGMYRDSRDLVGKFGTELPDDESKDPLEFADELVREDGKRNKRGGVVTIEQEREHVGKERKKGKGKRWGNLFWNRYKWILFLANTLFIAYSFAILVACLLVWFDIFYRADVIKVGNSKELILSTVAGSLCLFTSILGYAGILLNNRPFLAVYNVLLWACLAFIVAPGYLTYKQRTFNLEGKLNAQWSRDLGAEGRLRIQNQLKCCGYFSPFIEATVSNLCYARSILPGCKPRYLRFEREVLKDWYIASFSLVPAQIGVIVAALMCSNHVTYRFGKGLTPKRYRLDMLSMAAIMDGYSNQIAKQYGHAVAKETMQQSNPNWSDKDLPSVFDDSNRLIVPPSPGNSSVYTK